METTFDLTDVEKVFLYRCIVNRLPEETALQIFKREELIMIEFQIEKILSNKAKKEITTGLTTLAEKVGKLLLNQSLEEARETLN